MSKDLPGEWGKLLGPKGIHSYRDMAAATGIAAGTMHRLVTGKATSVETVNQVADTFFGGDRDLVWRLRGSRRRDHGDWQLPPESSLLTEAQRNAVLAVIQAMVPGEQEEVMGNAEHPAPNIDQLIELSEEELKVAPEEQLRRMIEIAGQVQHGLDQAARATEELKKRRLQDPQETAGEENQDPDDASG